MEQYRCGRETKLRNVLATFLVGVALATNVFAAPSAMDYEQTRELLASLENVKDDHPVLTTLFQNGDARIDDLIKALDDPDPKIRLRAQIVMRYLGNQAGIKALDEWYSKQREIVRSGPIPIPLTKRDYQAIANQSVEHNFDYIYALALDGSERAQSVLGGMMKSKRLDENSAAWAALNQVRRSQPRKVMTGKGGLAKLVLRNAFFVAPISKPFASARLFGLNGAKDKALVEVYVNPGPLAEEWYHVVITKRGRGWQFFSITQVAVS